MKEIIIIRRPAVLFCPCTVVKRVWWMAVVHFGALTQPGPRAPVNITAVSIVVYEPCRTRPAGMLTVTPLRAGTLRIWRQTWHPDSFLSWKHVLSLLMLWLSSSTLLITFSKINFILWTESLLNCKKLTFDGCTMTFVECCAMFMDCIFRLCSSTVSPAQKKTQIVVLV